MMLPWPFSLLPLHKLLAPELPPLPPQCDEDEGPGRWKRFEGPLSAIPRGTTACYRVYGDPKPVGVGSKKIKVSLSWERENMTKVYDLPGGIKKLYVHKLVAPYLREALRRAVIACPDYKIETIGCFNPRHMRHDTSRPLSTHTWGIAFDINAATNRAGTPGDMPPAFVEAFESVGFVWGGHWKGRSIDPMHFQLLKL